MRFLDRREAPATRRAGRDPQVVAFAQRDHALLRAAKPNCGFDQRLEDRLQVEG